MHNGKKLNGYGIKEKMKKFKIWREHE